ncbi:MAG: hypothetical protein ACRDAI_06900 [Candidatus Rhabdochlamydia sp.]
MNVNVLQSANSFMGQFGLAISNKKQILAKITAVALAAILLVGNLPSASAYDCTEPEYDNCWKACDRIPLKCVREGTEECIKEIIEKCISKCIDEWCD